MKDNFKNFRHLSLLLILLAGVSATGQTPQQPHPPGARSGFAGDPIQQLNLTPEQREQIRVIREENRDERVLVSQRVRQTNRALEEALETDSPDESLVEQRLREAGAAQAEAMRMRILTELKIRRVLTAEQRTLLRTLRRHVHENRIERRMDGQERRQKRLEDGSLRMRGRRNNGARPVPEVPPQPRPPL